MAESKLKPPALRPGDKIGIIAPASQIKREALEAGCAALRSFGYEPIYDEGIFDSDLFFAGRAERRRDELHAMFARPDVKAIVCARGGYGSNYLLPDLDLELIRKNPKLLIGYSDITSLMTFLNDRLGLVSLHGPMAVKDFALPDGVEEQSWLDAVTGAKEYKIDTEGATLLRAGEARGALYGGCLSMLAASLGTPYEIDTAGKVLFMEDIAAKPYQIDRMLIQMKYAGKLDGLRGIVIGEMVDCAQPGGQSYTLAEVFERHFGSLGIPVAMGVRSGHVSRANISLPIGVECELDCRGGEVSLTILESAVAG